MACDSAGRGAQAQTSNVYGGGTARGGAGHGSVPGLVLVLVLWLLLLQLVILRRGEALLAGEGAQAAVSLGGSRLVPSRHSARASAKPKATLGTAGSEGGQRLKAAVGKGGVSHPREQDEGPGAGGYVHQCPALTSVA